MEDRTWWRYFFARMLLAMEEPEEAERVMAPVRPLSPEATLGFERISIMSHTMRARIYLARGRADLARPWLESARRHLAERQLRSMAPEVEVCWGLLHRTEGDNEAARAAAARSLEQALAQQALVGVSADHALPDGLTDREAEIIRLVAQGLKDKEIGQQLFITVKTVQAHLRNIFNKVGVSNRAALTAYAARQGLIQ